MPSLGHGAIRPGPGLKAFDMLSMQRSTIKSTQQDSISIVCSCLQGWTASCSVSNSASKNAKSRRCLRQQGCVVIARSTVQIQASTCAACQPVSGAKGCTVAAVCIPGVTKRAQCCASAQGLSAAQAVEACHSCGQRLCPRANSQA